ncbi:MAG: prepilin-type N-terminal cleavage/methylation domain-containing protein [Candidatus Omnitrophica bacterium]|nr:prepilin-type N-terminal cleavage/methylation domain-containing protein [Candidatus Omnitrophota bacterium]
MMIARQTNLIKHGFTFIEVLIALGISIIVFVGIFQLFIHCTTLVEVSGDKNYVMYKIQQEMEKIRDYNFDLITTDYAPGGTLGNTFTLSPMTGIGVIEVAVIDANKLLKVRIVACWQGKNGRVIGEDVNFDGSLAVSEDVNNNLEIDSPATITTLISKR